MGYNRAYHKCVGCGKSKQRCVFACEKCWHKIPGYIRSQLGNINPPNYIPDSQVVKYFKLKEKKRREK